VELGPAVTQDHQPKEAGPVVDQRTQMLSQPGWRHPVERSIAVLRDEAGPPARAKALGLDVSSESVSKQIQSATPAESLLVIEPASPWRAVDLGEVWQYRELLYFFVWRDVKVRYKQTVFGVLWVIIRPVLSVAIFSVVFGHFAKIPSEGLPYPVFVLAAMIPWNFFSTALASGSGSLVGNANLITKVYFPRLVIPFASVVSSAFDVLISSLLVLVLMAWYGTVPPLSAVVTVPILFVITILLAIGISLWLGALNVAYRDVGNAIPFLLQIWMYVTPVVYPVSIIPPRWRWIILINPMAGVVDGFRSALFGRPWDPPSLLTSVVAAAILTGSGLLYFRASERTFADSV